MLRDLEDYRCKVYDQLQSNCQEFEAENQQLIQRHQLATEQIKRLKMLSDEQELQERRVWMCLVILRGITMIVVMSDFICRTIITP